MTDNWEVVIGLEVHVQLATNSKIFSGSSTAYGSDPNSQASLIDLGYPGTLPVINEAAVNMAIAFGIAVNGTIDRESIFARKNYFYPDLPKGYQISQYDSPIVSHGLLTTDPQDKLSGVPIVRAHLEEDAGKSIHFSRQGYTGIDLNRAGTPLLEVVTAPSIHSAHDAINFLRRLRELVVHLRICDGNMQEGSFRCDANVSVRPKNSKELGTRAEIKNLNSFRFVENAIEFERSRQIDILESGDSVIQETRLYDEKNNQTKSMRTKENEHDYRYFPDPDLLPLEIKEKQIAKISQNLPELPDTKRLRYGQDYGLSVEEISVLLSDPLVSDYFEEILAHGALNAKSCFNWITGELFRLLKKYNVKISESRISPADMALLLGKIESGIIPTSKGKIILQTMWEDGKLVEDLIKQEIMNLSTGNENLEEWINETLSQNKDQVTQFLSGKKKIFGFLVGQVMKRADGNTDPKIISEELSKILQNLKED